MASPLFCHCLLEDIGLEALLGVHLLQTPVFVLQLLQARHHRCIHAAVLGPPLIERGAAHAVLAAQLRHGRASLGLLEDRQDLAVAVTGLFHVETRRLRVRENSTSGRCYYAGRLPWLSTRPGRLLHGAVWWRPRCRRSAPCARRRL